MKQNKLLKDKLKKSEEIIKQKENEIKVITFECQKSIKAFQSLFKGLSLPQAIQDYSDLFELRQKQFKDLPKQKKELSYLG